VRCRVEHDGLPPGRGVDGLGQIGQAGELAGDGDPAELGGVDVGRREQVRDRGRERVEQGLRGGGEVVAVQDDGRVRLR
jgi:hypothetical protein